MAEDYIKEIIAKGDDASKVMKQICRATYGFQENVQTLDTPIGEQTILLPFEGKTLAIHSAGGNASLRDHREYAASLVERLVEKAKKIDAIPIAMTNTLDMSDIDLEVVKQAGEGLYQEARHHGIAIINGEIAGLGDRVTVPFNISGTMLSIATEDRGGSFYFDGTDYLFISDEGKFIFMNSDGVGSKIEIGERTGSHHHTTGFLAMVMDDQARLYALTKAVSAVLECGGLQVPIDELIGHGFMLAKSMGCMYSMHSENMLGRVAGYGDNPYNLGGTAVGLIDPEIAEDMPSPKPGDSLIDVRDPVNINFRCNGYSKLRPAAEELWGKEWHTKEFQGQNLGSLIGAPATIFYPEVTDLADCGIISGFFHMSGGAHNGKLAKPLAKLGLYAELSDLFEPHPLMLKIQEHCGLSDEKAYEIWGMNNEAYIATAYPGDAISVLKARGLEARVGGTIQKAKGKTGVTLKLPGGDVHYSGT